MLFYGLLHNNYQENINEWAKEFIPMLPNTWSKNVFLHWRWFAHQCESFTWQKISRGTGLVLCHYDGMPGFGFSYFKIRFSSKYYVESCFSSSDQVEQPSLHKNINKQQGIYSTCSRPMLCNSWPGKYESTIFILIVIPRVSTPILLVQFHRPLRYCTVKPTSYVTAQFWLLA